MQLQDAQPRGCDSRWRFHAIKACHDNVLHTKGQGGTGKHWAATGIRHKQQEPSYQHTVAHTNTGRCSHDAAANRLVKYLRQAQGLTLTSVIHPSCMDNLSTPSMHRPLVTATTLVIKRYSACNMHEQ